MTTHDVPRSRNCVPPQSSRGLHASRCPAAESGEDARTTDGHGTTCLRLFPEPDQHMLPPRTPWDWLTTFQPLILSSAVWRRYRTQHARLFWMLQPSGSTSGAGESGYWPTPLASDGKGGAAGGKPSYLRHFCHTLGRRDLMRSAKFRLKLMGFPEDYLDDPTDSEQSETR